MHDAAHQLGPLSLMAFWEVEGRLPIRTGPLHAAAAGGRGLLASTTNAPIMSSHFLDQQTSSDKLRGHESRLALALNIDQAERVLPSDGHRNVAALSHIDKHQPLE